MRTCRLSNFTGYLRVTTKWELQPQVANSASRSSVPTLLFGLMDQKHTDLEKFTKTYSNPSEGKTVSKVNGETKSFLGKKMIKNYFLLL